MPTPRIDMDQAEVERLYWEEGMSLAEAAAELGVSAATVRVRMVEWDIPRRHGAAPWRDADWLRERADTGMSRREIADEAGCQVATVAQWLRIHRIEGFGRRPTHGLARRLLEMDPDEVARR